MDILAFRKMLSLLPLAAKLVVVRDQMTFGLKFVAVEDDLVRESEALFELNRNSASTVAEMLATLANVDEEALVRVDGPVIRTIKASDYQINDCDEIVLEVECPTGTVHSHTNCREPQGITVGLIDGIIAMARVLRHHNVNVEEVQEALKDLRADEDVAWLLGKDS